MVETTSKIEAFERFFDQINPVETEKRLRNVLIEYMRTDNAKESFDTNDTLTDFERIFQLLAGMKK